MTESEYVQTVEETFIRLRGNGLFLSSQDTLLICSWREQGIPLHVVVGGIEEVMEKRTAVGSRQSAGNLRPVRSLSYCREEVESRYAEWLEGRVGAHV